MAPAFADLYTRTRRLDEGRRYLNGEIARAPGDLSLRLLRGRMELLSGDAAAAEREYRSILAADPTNKGALEALVALLDQSGRSTDAAQEVLAAAGRQPANAANNLRAAILCDQRGDGALETEYLLAAERSGPVTSSIELQIARQEFGRQRADVGLLHLALARRIAGYEGDPAVPGQIGQAIDQVLLKLQSR
jgi:thioredoxin-like negative regulator of GroEL